MKKITDGSAIFSIVGKTCFLFAVAFMLSPSSVEAQCEQWDFSGDWNVVLANGPTVSLKNLTQSLADYQGPATASSTPVFQFSGAVVREERINFTLWEGNVFGSFQGDKFAFQITWRSNLRGETLYSITSRARSDQMGNSKVKPLSRRSWER
jgi:hypothetical protein